MVNFEFLSMDFQSSWIYMSKEQNPLLIHFSSMLGSAFMYYGVECIFILVSNTSSEHLIRRKLLIENTNLIWDEVIKFKLNRKQYQQIKPLIFWLTLFSLTNYFQAKYWNRNIGEEKKEVKEKKLLPEYVYFGR